MEPRKQKLEAPGHERRFKTLRERLRQLTEAEISAVQAERHSWLQKPRRSRPAVVALPNAATVGNTTTSAPAETAEAPVADPIKFPVEADLVPIAPRAEPASPVMSILFVAQIAGTMLVVGCLAYVVSILMV